MESKKHGLFDTIKAHTDSVFAELEKSFGKVDPNGPSEYFLKCKPTFIENWPRSFCNRSLVQIDIPLTPKDTQTFLHILRNVWDSLENSVDIFKEMDDEQLTLFDLLESYIDSAIKNFRDGAFIRLGSRSPKDSPLFLDTEGLCRTGREAMDLLTSFSERIFEDLMDATKAGYGSHIFVREWVPLQPWQEFRCFVRDKKLVGISQYNYLDGHLPRIKEYRDSIRWVIEECFMPGLIKDSHLDDVVVDVFIKKIRSSSGIVWETKLLEINPFCPGTDPCLFDWRDGGDFDGSFRIIEEELNAKETI